MEEADLAPPEQTLSLSKHALITKRQGASWSFASTPQSSREVNILSYTQRDAERELAARTEVRGKLALSASVGGRFFGLPHLHPMDDHEVAHAIHVVQSKLLSRAAYRRCPQFARVGTSEARLDV